MASARSTGSRKKSGGVMLHCLVCYNVELCLKFVIYFLVYRFFSEFLCGEFLMWKLSSCTQQIQILMTLKRKALENIVGKGENAGNQHFLLFQQCFLTCHKQILLFAQLLKCCLQVLSIWTSVTFCYLVKS